MLDLGLPDISGIEVITGLRGWTQVPIIVLSGRADAADKVEALDAGADDYVTKPFNMDELLARIRATLRHHTADAPRRITFGDHAIDLSTHRVTHHTGVEPTMHLTPTEWKILTVLARHPGALVESQRLLTEVWGPHYHTEAGLGYRYQP